jgi:hypothetical protein
MEHLHHQVKLPPILVPGLLQLSWALNQMIWRQVKVTLSMQRFLTERHSFALYANVNFKCSIQDTKNGYLFGNFHAQCSRTLKFKYLSPTVF